MKTIIAKHEIEGQFTVEWYSIGVDFYVAYGANATVYENKGKAAEAFGRYVQFQAECAGRFDDWLLESLKGDENDYQ